MARYDYDLIVIGGGAAGFVASKLANGLGKRVVLIEKKKLGGDCTNYGCIPSKALIHSAGIAYHMNNLRKYGLETSLPIDLNTDRVMPHVRSVVGKVSAGHSPDTFQKLGIDVLFGEPRFIDNHSIEMDRGRLSATAFILSTGSRAFIPAIDGIQSVPFLTNETIFDMERLPSSMIVLGGGPIGIELASALNRLGVEITVVEMNERILIREDEELVRILTRLLKEEGLHIMTGTRATRLHSENGKIALSIEYGNRKGELKADSLLIATGRSPNVEGLGLENAGVEYTSKGIRTDDRLRTTSPNIYACGDVVGPYQFSHMAEYQAVIATRNALMPVKKKVHYENVAWCTFTDPELAHAGLTEEEARKKYGEGVKVYRQEYGNIDRGKTDVSETGMSKFVCDPAGRLVGAHILGNRAGDLIHEAQIAKSLGIPFYRLYTVIHIYPTFTDVVKHASKLCYIERLQSNVFLKIFRKFFQKK